MKAKTIILFVLGAIFVFGIPSYKGVGATLVGIFLAALCFYTCCRTGSEQRASTGSPQRRTIRIFTHKAGGCYL